MIINSQQNIESSVDDKTQHSFSVTNLLTTIINLYVGTSLYKETKRRIKRLGVKDE